MTVEKSYIESQPQAGLGWYKRVFAWLMAQGDNMMIVLCCYYASKPSADLHGDVLEMGPGTGPNLPYYPQTFTGLGLSRIRICTRTLRKKQINSV